MKSSGKAVIWALAMQLCFVGTMLGMDDFPDWWPYPKMLDNCMKRYGDDKECMSPFDGAPYGLSGAYDILQEVTEELRKGERYTIRLLDCHLDYWPVEWDAVNGEPYDASSRLEVVTSGGSSFLVDLGGRDSHYPLEIHSFISPEKKEILFSAQSGSIWEGYRAFLYEIHEDHAVLLFDNNKDAYASVSGRFLDDYRAEFVVSRPGRKLDILLDLSGQKEDRRKYYISYDDSGKLYTRSPAEEPFKPALGGGVNWILPVDFDGDGVYELKGVVACVGETFADTLCRYEFILKCRDGKWEQIDTKVIPAEGVKVISAKPIDSVPDWF